MLRNNIKESLRFYAYKCLSESNPEKKVALTYQVYELLENNKISIGEIHSVDNECNCGKPDTPELVPAYQLPKRRVGSEQGHVALFHSFAHIEFNAINIAWDAVYRFSDMPNQFYKDWARVAKEEAYHFELINDYLKSYGYEYGSFQAHDDLWEMVRKTSHDVLIRMALVPRVLEARGLDVTPAIIDKFTHHGYDKAADILQIIYRDEIGHVKIGTHWFNYLCDSKGLNPEETFTKLLREYAGDKIKKPFNDIARLKAGFTQTEMELLNSWKNS